MSKQIEELFKKQSTRIKSIAFHPTNPVIITANHCGTVYIWNILYQQIISVLREHEGSVRCVKIHPSGDIFATAGDDKKIRIWNYKTRRVVRSLKGHTDYIRGLDFHPTKPWIVSASDDSTIKVWNFYTGEQLSSSSGHTHYVMDVLFLDSNHILSGSLDHTIGLWSCSNLFEKKKFMVPEVVLIHTIEAHDRGVNCLCMQDGHVLSGSDDRGVKVWKYTGETLLLEKTLYSHDGNVTSVLYEDGVAYGGGEDGILSFYSAGKPGKIGVSSRIWSLAGRDGYIAVGTDDGLVMYRKTPGLVSCVSQSHIYYTVSNAVFKYNMRQAVDYCKIKEDAKSMIFHKDNLYILYGNRYEIYNEGKKIGSDLGSIAFIGDEKYTLHDDSIFKNDILFRNDIQGILHSSERFLFVIDDKTLTVISGDQETTATYNFPIKSVITNGEKIAIIGGNKILILDTRLQVLHSIDELVEITGGIFYDDLLIYATLKQLKFFYEDTGILQSVNQFQVPVMMHEDYLCVLTSEGIDKVLLNMSEIRFRRAVINDEDILSTIEEEQLPGLSPLEYLMRKNKGEVALPFIKDDEKRFQLFLNAKNYEEALKLCTNNKMYNELGFHSLQNGRYDISETCFRRNSDEIHLFYLFLCTKQLEKLKDLKSDEVENMAKIVLEDRSVIDRFAGGEIKCDDMTVCDDKAGCDRNADKEQSINRTVHSSVSTDQETDSSNESKDTSTQYGSIETMCDDKSINHTDSSSQEDEMVEKLKNVMLLSRNEHTEEDVESESQPAEHVKSIDSTSTEDNKLNANDSTESYITEDIKTDQATLNDSDFQSQIFDISEIDLDDEKRNHIIEERYQHALDLTTQGKFSKAIDVFRECISLIALKMTQPLEFCDQRRLMGNYILGLHIEKSRKGIEDPVRNIQMSLFFATLKLEPVHVPLVKNLAMKTCFKHGNRKTAYEIASEYPECKNSKKILSDTCETDAYEIPVCYVCYDTLTCESESKECAMCFVKSKEGETCQACGIGILH